MRLRVKAAGLLACLACLAGLWGTSAVAQSAPVDAAEAETIVAPPPTDPAQVLSPSPDMATLPVGSAPSAPTPAEAVVQPPAQATPAVPSTAPTNTRGVASWYGRQFHGRKTASGERFNMYGLTAAHKTLPLMSYVRVSNPANGKSIVVRITDRGPFAPNRMIDLSYGAAQELDIKGLGEVEMDQVDRAEYEAQSDQATIERDLREASFVPVPARRVVRKPAATKPARR